VDTRGRPDEVRPSLNRRPAADGIAVAATRFEAPVLAPTARRQSADELEREHQRAEARRRGRAEGLAMARAEVEAAVAAQAAAARRLTIAAAALERAATDLAGRDAANLRLLEHEAVRLAATLAEEIVGAELRAVDEPVLEAIRRSISFLPDRGDLVVRVHPDDVATTSAALAAWPAVAMRAVVNVPDASIERGGCVLEVGPCRVDAQIGPALQRLRVALGAESSQEMVELLALSGLPSQSEA
jgi:flagellar assembly protein FliH